MPPIVLHFHVFQATGVKGDVPETLEVTSSMTVGAVKAQVFSDAFAQSRSVRFIASGRVLHDSASLGSCGIGQEAYIHVMVGEPQISQELGASTAQGPSAVLTPTKRLSLDAAALLKLVALLALIAAGAGFYVAWQRRKSYTMQTSQMLCILAAVWAYALLFHGLPAVVRALGALSRGDKGSGWVAVLPAPVLLSAMLAQGLSATVLGERG
jgi:hypothetical protein